MLYIYNANSKQQILIIFFSFRIRNNTPYLLRYDAKTFPKFYVYYKRNISERYLKPQILSLGYKNTKLNRSLGLVHNT